MKNTEGRRQKAEGGVTERAPARTFQDLIVWQKSHSLVLKIYKHSKSFPNNEIESYRVSRRPNSLNQATSACS